MAPVAYLRKLAHARTRALACAVLLVLLSVLGLRALGALESAELASYDWYLRLRQPSGQSEPRVVIVSVTENDIRSLGGWPTSDDNLARAIEMLASHKPRAIGIDLYRDIEIEPGSERLHRVLARETRVIGVQKFGESSSEDISAHRALRGTERIGFNDILVDPGGTVRRGLLFLDDGKTTAYAFALRLALLYLQAEGVSAQPAPEDPSHLRLGRTTIQPFEPNDGAYVGADARGYQFLLDFRGSKAAFPMITLGALLAGEVDPGAIRDKIVLVGVVAESVKDLFYTPHSRGLLADQQFAGVLIHAHIADQLLRIALDGATLMRTPPKAQAIAWILIWSLAGGLLGMGIRSPWVFAIAVTGGLGAIKACAYLGFEHGLWIPLIPAATAWIAAAAIVTAYMSHQESAQRRALMRLFSRNVSKEVAESLWRNKDAFLDGGRPRSEALIVTALFTDLRGFTTVSEKLGPKALMEWLTEYMGPMTELIGQHGGVLRQYAGDGIVALFGIPVPRRTDAEIAQDAINAVRCALSMDATLSVLNRRWAEQGRPVTGMRVGIFTGPAIAGTLGTDERSEYVVVGDTMNTASRLESYDKELFPPDLFSHPCRILIGETTWAHLGGLFVGERVGDVSLKGKEQPVSIYHVPGYASGAETTVNERSAIVTRACLLVMLAMLSAGVASTGPAAAAEKTEPTPPAQTQDSRPVVPSEGATVVVYKPPLRGAPGGRVGGSTRGAGQPVFSVWVLAPDHTGLTTSEHPSLYWYLSGTSASPVEITLLDPRAIKPLLQTTLSAPVAAGVHALRLADLGIRLEPGIAYRWYVAVVTNATRRSKDVLAGGAIERISTPEDLQRALAQANPANISSLLAQAGLWYDAVATISQQIEAAPADPNLRGPRAALLSQVGLTDIKD